MMHRHSLTLGCFLIAGSFCHADHWPQFRGPDGQAVAQSDAPIHFGPRSNVLWQSELPTGHSSPCIWGNRIFLTGFDRAHLDTLCLDRATGKILWKAAAPAEKIEGTHRIGSPAASTPATDGQRVYVYFGSFGLLAYDFQGKEIWRKPLPTPMVEFGTGSSPMLAGNLLILLCDQDLDSFLLAVDGRTGSEVWRAERPEFRRGFSTPFVWRHDGLEELIVPGSIQLSSYNLKDGTERWFYHGTARVANASPTSGEGLLFSSSWNIGGDAGQQFSMPAFADYARENDRNKDGVLSLEEITIATVKQRYSQMDLDKDNRVTAEEWRLMAEMYENTENALVAIKPGGQGNITETHLAWKITRSLPYVPSPLYYQGRIYTIRNGGMASCLEAKTGRFLYQDERLNAPGDYYASPIAFGNHVLMVSQRGLAVALEAGDTFAVASRNDLDEEVFATPAVVNGVLYLRTVKRLFAFGPSKRLP